MLTTIERSAIVAAYSVGHETMAALAIRYGVSRQSIHKTIVASGVDIASCAKVTVPCSCCGIPVSKARCYYRKTINVYCSRECYYKVLHAGKGQPYKASRQGGRIARATISKVFNLQDKHIVHHVDRDQTNNTLSNLWVFACSADHVSFHRGGKGQPIYRGAA